MSPLVNDGRNSSIGIVILLGILKRQKRDQLPTPPNQNPSVVIRHTARIPYNRDRGSVKDTSGLPIHINSFLPHDLAFLAIGVLTPAHHLISLLLAYRDEVKIRRER